MFVLVSGNSGHVDTSDIRDAYLSNLSADRFDTEAEDKDNM